MRLLLSGEGPTDLGKCIYPQSDRCRGRDFAPGPMARILDLLVREETGRSFLDDGEVEYVSEGALRDMSKRERRMVLSGLKGIQGTGFYRKNAFVLGTHACEVMNDSGCPVVAVLFRDSDGTHAVGGREWKPKFDSIAQGFLRAGFRFGVPMVPKPKSESWLLCAVEKDYQGCAVLEDLSGNDASPKSAKKRLAGILGEEPTAETQAGLIRDGEVDPARIDMPSYNAFRDALHDALRKCR